MLLTTRVKLPHALTLGVTVIEGPAATCRRNKNSCLPSCIKHQDPHSPLSGPSRRLQLRPRVTEVSSALAVSLDVSALRSRIVGAVVSEIRTVIDEHYSNIKTELLDMKSELLCDFAMLRSDFAGLKSTVSDIERSLSTCTDDVVELQARVECLSKEISRLDAKCDDLESRSCHQNIRIVGIPEGESFNLTTSSVSEKEAFALDKPRWWTALITCWRPNRSLVIHRARHSEAALL
ncbi:hypothetical protein SRHO_G00098320 [Serrasalmus rhombeus]